MYIIAIYRHGSCALLVHFVPITFKHDKCIIHEVNQGLGMKA